MAVAGYSCLVRKSGVSTGVATELCSLLSGSVVFRITNAAKRVIDPTIDFSFKDGATTVAYSSISVIDFVNGEVTFAAPLSSPNSLSFTGNFLPITTTSDTILETKSFKLSCSQDMLDRTVLTGSSTDYVRKRLQAIKDVSLSVNSIAQPTDLQSLATAQFNATPVVAEVFFGDSASVPRFRGFCQLAEINTQSSEEGFGSETEFVFKISSILNTTANQVAGFAFKIQP
jgi:hypothetical protein